MDGVINGEISEESSAKEKENDTPVNEDFTEPQISDVSELESKDNAECLSSENILTNSAKDGTVSNSLSVNQSQSSPNKICSSFELLVNNADETSVAKENGLCENASAKSILDSQESVNLKNDNSCTDIESDKLAEQSSSKFHTVSELKSDNKKMAQECPDFASTSSDDPDPDSVKTNSESNESSFKASSEDKKDTISTDVELEQNDFGNKKTEMHHAEVKACDLTTNTHATKNTCETDVSVLDSSCSFDKTEDTVTSERTTDKISSCDSVNAAVSSDINAKDPLNFSVSSISPISDVSIDKNVADVPSKSCSKSEEESCSALSLIKESKQSSEISMEFNSCPKQKSVSEDNCFNLSSPGCSFPHVSVKPVEFGENCYTEPNPLEKLNEHLNSIGFGKHQMHSYHQTQNSTICTLNTIPPTASKPETFKNCHKGNKIGDSTSSFERSNNDSCDNLVFTELSKEETGFPDIFTGLVAIGKYISVKGDFTLRSTEALVESPSSVAPYLLKEPDTFPPKLQESKGEPKDFFHSAAGEILIGIGLSRVNEWFHRDMVRIKKRQIKREGKLPQLEEDLNMHEACYLEAKKANNVYSFSYKSCETCGFTTESSVVMEGHLLVPHITQRREYQCNFCSIVNRDPKAMIDHMETVHGKIGRIQPPVLFFECPYCPFESNSKVKLNTHLTKCQRYFDSGINQAPPRDFEFPALTPKPITVAVVKAYEKSLSSMQRGRGRPKKIDSIIQDSVHMNQFSSNISHPPIVPNHIPPYRSSSNTPLSETLSMQNHIIPPIQMPNMNLRPAHTNAMGQLRSGIPSPLHLPPPPPPNRFFQVVNSTAQLMPMLGNSHLVTSPSQFPFSSNLVNTNSKKVHAPTAPFFNSLFGNGSGLRQQNPSKTVPDITITPLPKLQGPYPVPLVKPSTPSGTTSMQSNSLVVCEICDGYIKDLEQLRTHMQLIHKVKIHPKMLVSRPPLNCQKCQWRFFTDQGLERHLLGAHGLVTSNMQELANKSKDAGCCTICGRVYASKLVSHMNQVHKVTLKPAHLSYKCTVCSATFNLYRLFENHVYLVHSGAAKRPADANSNPSKKLKLPNVEKADLLAESETLNHKEKRLNKDGGEENRKKCKECGMDILDNSRYALQSERCEKCLKSDELVQGTLSSKAFRAELRKPDKICDNATF